jgi:hypothetical protein
MRRSTFISALMVGFALLITPWGSFDGVPVAQQAPSFQVLQSDLTGVTLELLTPSFQVTTSAGSSGLYDQISVPGLSTAGKIGQPQLPVKTVRIGIRADNEVELEILQIVSERVALSHPLALRSQTIMPSDPDSSEISFESQEIGNYDLADPFPASPALVGAVAWIRNQPTISVSIYPFQYQASEEQLLWHKQLRIRLNFVHGSSQVGGSAPRPETTTAVATGAESSVFEDILRSQLVNYEAARSWRISDLAQVTWNPAPPTDLPPGSLKVIVDHAGIYRLSFNDLQAVGMQVDTLDPRTFRLTNQGRQVSITVSGEGDGRFDPVDFIEFYGEPFTGDYLASLYAAESSRWMTYTHQLTDGNWTSWHAEFNAEMLEKFTDKNVYWLSSGGVPGPRILESDAYPHDTAPVPQVYTATLHFEQSHEWYTYNFSSEDTWYWERIRNTVQRTYPFTLTAVAGGAYSARISGAAAARTSHLTNNPDHHTVFSLNSQAVPLADAFWDGISRYTFSAEVPQSELLSGLNQLKLAVKFDAYVGQLTDDIYFDEFSLDYARNFQADADQIAFTRDEAGGTWQYEVSNFTSGSITIYDVTDPLNPRRLVNPSFSNGVAVYEAQHSGQAKYFLSGNDSLQTPASITMYTPPDLLSAGTAVDYVFITHRDFFTSTQALADYRAAQGLKTLVVDVDDLYNLFNFGVYHPIAIKNFLAYALASWQVAPTYALLVGDGHWNFKGFESTYSPGLYDSPYPNYMPPFLAFVDPIQGEVDTANLLAAVIGDDILPDVIIGRLPVNTSAELDAIRAKLAAYEQAPFQDWQQRLLFIADNQDDAGDFRELAEGVIADYVTVPFIADRIYLDPYIDSGECVIYGKCPAVNHVITETLNLTGTFLVNYIGHASNNRWAHEYIFENDDIQTLSNLAHLPVVLSMDCLDGFWTYPSQQSLVEELLRADGKGAIATFSPTGLGVATGHDTLQRGFYDSLFNEGNWELGAASLAAKVALEATQSFPDLINTYTVFGDPALRLLNPYRAELSLDTIAGSGYTGTSYSYPLLVVNSGNAEDTFDLGLSDNSWSTTVSQPVAGPLAPGSSAVMTITVDIPATVAGGESDRVTILATSRGDRGKVARAEITTTALVYGLSVTPLNPSLFAQAGESVAYTLSVANTGSLAENYSLTVSGNSWSTTGPAETGVIGAGEKADVVFTVSIPDEVTDLSQDVALVTISAQTNPALRVIVNLTTTARNSKLLFLPILARQNP